MDVSEPGTPTSEEVRAQLERLLASPTFERALRLQKFLKYTCELTLRGEGERINEYLIGMEVFGRGEDYSTGDDGVVRRQAHALRQKLQSYYQEQGRLDPIQIVLPIGRYVPIFRRQESRPPEVNVGSTASTPDASLSRPHPNDPGRASPWRSRLALATVGGCVAALAFAGILSMRARPARDGIGASSIGTVNPAVRAVWDRWLKDGRPATICLGKSMTAVVSFASDAETATEMAGQAGGRMPLVSGSELDQFLRRSFKLPLDGHLLLSPDTTEGKLREAEAAIRISAFLGRLGPGARPTQARFLNWELLRSENVILLGGPEDWVHALMEKYSYRLDFSPGKGGRRIFNSKKAATEQESYSNRRADGPDGPFEQYALVSMVPGPGRRGQLLLVNGLTPAATDSAADFLTDPQSLSGLAERLLAASGHGGPWYFQLVLRAEVRRGTAMKSSIVALTVL